MSAGPPRADRSRVARLPADPLEAGVVLAVEQLRRRVPGGVGTYARGLLLGLARLGGDAPSHLLLASRAKERPDPLSFLGPPVRNSALPGRLLVEAWGRGLAGVGAGPALAHAVSLAAPPSRPPLVVTVHDLAWRRFPDAYPRRGRRWHEAALERARRRASAFVVPSEPVAEELAASGIPRGSIRVVPEGADHLGEPDLAAAGRLLGGLGVQGPFLLSVGTLEPRKNLAKLVAAYRLARKGFAEPWPLVVVGPTGWGEVLARSELPEGVLLAGQVSEAVLAGCYHLARVFVYTPLGEGFGLPAVEAMAAGVPVVASAVPSAGEAAWTVDPGDVDSIAGGLSVVAGDEVVRARLVAAGQARAASLTWADTARQHVELWREVASTSGGTHRGRRAR